jgi:hypothetical protein
MRAGTLSGIGVATLAILAAGQDLGLKEQVSEIPRYAVERHQWVCLDRDPRQVARQDCLPRRK